MPWSDLVVPAAVTIWNVITFAVYGADKRRARKGKRRVPERTLLMMAATFCSVGALLGMRVFRHKTRKTRFRLWIPLFLLAHLALVLWLCWGDFTAVFV